MSTCALHPFTEATHRCSGCERRLCEECGTRLSYCGACGAHVLRLGEEEPEHWFDELFNKAQPRTGDGDLVSFVILHAVVPAAIIGMVYGLLFYMLLIRSIFFGNTGVLQWVGLLFIVATVLTARYGRTRGDKATQAMYSLILFGATGLALTTRSPSTAATLANLGLLAVVWLYATGVTYAVSIEGSGRTSRRGAVAPVVGMGLFAMVVFAAGEPLMLNAETDIAIQAIVAIIGYLVCTGVVLAAASTISQARRAYRTGGDVALRVVRERIGTAAAIGLVIVAIGLTLPGVQYSGSGRLELAPDEMLQQRRLQRGIDATAGALGETLVGGLPWGWLSGFESLTTSSGQAAAALAVVRFMQLFGFVVALIIIVSVVAYAVRLRVDALGRLAPLLRRYADWIRARLAARLPAWERRGNGRRGRSAIDPFAGLGALAMRPVREAIVEAYARATVLLERLDYPRSPEATPHDLLGALPDRLGYLADPLGEITGLYVRAAYSNEALTAADREGAVATLVAMRDRLAAGRSDE